MNKLIALMTCVLMAGIAFSGVTTHFALDCREGARELPEESVNIRYDASWYADGVTAKIFADGKEIVSGSAGVFEFTPTSGGANLLTLNAYNAEEEIVGTASVFCLGSEDVTELVIPEGTTEIGGYVFNGGQLTSVKIPNSVTNVAPTAFAGCVNLTNVEICGGISKDQDRRALKRMFPDSPIASVTIGEGVVSLPDGFFEDCETITSLSLPNSLQSFGDNDVREIGRRMGVEGAWVQDGWLLGYFGSAPALFECPADVRDLAAYALAGQPDVERVVLPDSIKSVGGNAFAGDEALRIVFFKGDAPRADSAFFRGAASALVTVARKDSAGWSGDRDVLPDFWPESEESRPMRVWTTYPKSSWPVRFDLGGCGVRSGGGELEQLVVDGENAVAPEVAAFAEDGYEFNGWDRPFTNVTESMTVRAKYLKDGQDVGTGFTLATGGDAQWTKIGKKHCAGNIEIGDEVWLEMRVRGEVLVYFKWWVDYSSYSWQYQTTLESCKVFVDGEQKVAPIYVNGADWGTFCGEFAIYGDGEHVIRWSFTRDSYSSEYNGFAVGDISWRPAPEYVTLTLDPTLGEVEPTQLVVAADGTYGSLPVPTRDGVEFAGWSIDNGDPECVSEDDRVPLADATLYARWNPTKEQAVDPKGTLSKVEFAEASWSVDMRYDYVDWSTNTRKYYEQLRCDSYFSTPTTQTLFRATVAGVGSLRIADLYSYYSSVKAYLDGEEVEMPAYGNGEMAFKLLTGGEHEFRIDVELGAYDSRWVYFELGAMQWASAPSRMVVEFNPMGGKASSPTKGCRPGQAYGELPTVDERPGYEFLGWFTEPDGGEQKSADDLVDFEATTLYAHWRAGLSEALNNGELTFASSGPTGWEGRSGSSHDGVAAAVSGWLEWNETNTLSTAVTGKGVLSFWWKVAPSEPRLKFLLEVDDAQIELSWLGYAATKSDRWLHFFLTLTNDCAHTVKWLVTPDSDYYNKMLASGYDPGSVREQLEERRAFGWYGPVSDPGAWVDEVTWQPDVEQKDVVQWGHSAWQAQQILPGKADPMMAWCTQRIADNPSDYDAYVRRAITRIKALSEAPALKSLLSRYGFVFSPERKGFLGEFNVNTAPASNDAADELVAEVGPSLEAIYADLQKIPEGWAGVVALSASEYPVDEDIYIDYADVVMAKSLVKGLMSFMHIILSYDLTVDNEELKAEIDAWMAFHGEDEECPLLMVEALLKAHPNFARGIRSPEHLVSAREELRLALELCAAFDAAVKTRTSGRMHFFEYDPTYADQWQAVVKSVQLAKTGLDEIVTVKGENYACFTSFKHTNLNERVTLKPFFEGKILRSLLPPFEGNRPVLSSLPDITFAGMFPDWTMNNRMDWLLRFDGVWYDETPAPTVVAPETFVGPFAKVCLEDRMSDVAIFYTVDGTEPALQGKKYAGPFHVCDTVTIRAVAFSAQYGFSKVAEAQVEKLFGRGDAIGSYEGVFEDDTVAPWSIDATVAHEGGAASMRSGRIQSSEEWPDRNYSTLSATYSGRGVLSFWWKVSCEDDGSALGAEYDFLGVYVDGELVRAIDGKTDWMRVEIDLPDDTDHRIEWRYSKDDMDDGDIGSDCGWIDDVVWMSKSQAGDLTGSTLSTSPQIPYAWLDQHGLGPRNVDGGHTFEQAARRISPHGKRDGAGKPMTVVDEYIAGTDPQNEDDTFHAILEFENGKPVIKWHPKLPPADEALRTYRSFGRESLKNGDWVELPDGKTDGFNFFKTSVEWK